MLMAAARRAAEEEPRVGCNSRLEERRSVLVE